MIQQKLLIPLLSQYINQGYGNKRKKPNGGLISKNTVDNYTYLRKILIGYEAKISEPLVIYDIRKATKRELNQVKNHWKNFYLNFSNYLYSDLKCYDNYVGQNFKLLKAFFIPM